MLQEAQYHSQKGISHLKSYTIEKMLHIFHTIFVRLNNIFKHLQITGNIVLIDKLSYVLILNDCFVKLKCLSQICINVFQFHFE